MREGGQWIEIYNPTNHTVSFDIIVIMQQGKEFPQFSTPLNNIKSHEYKTFEIWPKDSPRTERFGTEMSGLSFLEMEKN